MEKYDVLLNEIKEYLNKKEVDNLNANNEVVSIYDVYSAINEELEGLRKISKNSKLEKKLKRFMYWAIPSKKDKFFNCEKLYVNIFGNYEISKIVISTEPIGFSWYQYEISINKDRGSDHIYINKEKNQENASIYKFIKTNYNFIMEIFSQIEYYSDLFDFVSNVGEESYHMSSYLKVSKSPRKKDMSFFDNLFTGTLNVNYLGEVIIKINLISSHPLYDEYSKNWYNRESVHEFADKHKEEILKRIPISPYQLQGILKKVYNKHIEKTKETEKVKSLRINR